MATVEVRASFHALLLVALLLGFLDLPAVSRARAEPVAIDEPQAVEDSRSELDAIKAELQYLRARDVARQAWEESVASGLPSALPPQVRLDQVLDDDPALQLPEVGAGEFDNICCGAPTCGCDCQCGRCPLPPAPCIECPHATTLNPFSNIHFFGALKLDMLFNSARPVSAGTPFFLAPDSLTGLDQDTVDIHGRQTTLGAAIVGPQMGGFQSGGTVVGMLFNDNVLADKYGFLPLQAFGELKNDEWRIAGGLQFDVFAPSVPTVLPFSALAASGNAGNSFRGQLRLERFLHVASDVQWTLQGALSEPITTTIDPTFGISEDNGWPNIEGRAALGLGEFQGTGLMTARPFEVGLSGVGGQIRTTSPPPVGRVVADVWGLAADARWRMTQRFGVAGEVYSGQGLGTYNGAILQETNTDTLEVIRSTGGWLEGFYYWTPCLHSHTGYAADDPMDADVADSAAALGRTYNSTLYSNFLWDWNQAFRMGFEFTWRQTSYKSAANPDNEGAGFHTQLQWAF